ncbi:hypothetical protein O3G_MSEX004285 [Manduca sexta]|uniref:Uncharacterized protein n=1 Tax=Manduca sexta TaxID=7130 RepID=A0A921YUZ1_MANSE|nr:hypothetical protein O3G_MSEX004285 [Manduca sexta]
MDSNKGQICHVDDNSLFFKIENDCLDGAVEMHARFDVRSEISSLKPRSSEVILAFSLSISPECGICVKYSDKPALCYIPKINRHGEAGVLVAPLPAPARIKMRRYWLVEIN